LSKGRKSKHLKHRRPSPFRKVVRATEEGKRSKSNSPVRKVVRTVDDKISNLPESP